MSEYKYFTEEEFNHLTPQCSLSDMDSEFMKRLDVARHLAGFPFVLNCAFRNKSWEKAHNRSGASFHCKGQAVDIRCCDGKKRALIVYSCWLAGLKGIGIYPTFVHIDMRNDPCLFLDLGDASKSVDF